MTAPRTARIGIVGAGTISAQYSNTLATLRSVRVNAVADLDLPRAEALAARHPGATARPLPALLGADDVDVVLNLTVPAAHAEVSLAALAAGKHVYAEKPLASTTDLGRAVARAAEAAGRRVGCAPDTVLGTGFQTARSVLASGAIGTPHGATAFMTTPGHERWHPDPEFYYRPGGGPLLDMGPYYLTALVHLLGPVVRVVGLGARPAGSRRIGSGARRGESFEVEVDTHISGVLEHAGGALSTLLMSFDTWAARLPRIEVYGSAGSLSVPDPNHFDGGVAVFTADEGHWRQVPARAGYLGAGRGIGVADLARGIAAADAHRCSLDLALHVLDVMESLLLAARTGTATTVATSCLVPAPVPALVELRTEATA
jgi:predicted dehydrogenase